MLPDASVSLTMDMSLYQHQGMKLGPMFSTEAFLNAIFRMTKRGLPVSVR